jgi:D-amino-acid dehydrogenase
MTWDGLPIIGRAPNIDNAYLATGHNMIGMMSAPATGKLIAEIIGQKKTHIECEAYAPSRFN